MEPTAYVHHGQPLQPNKRNHFGFARRVPAPGWQPKGWIANEGRGGPTTHNVHVHSVHRTPQFWLLFIMLCFNVTAGIGVIGVAKTMVRDIFAGVPSTLAPGTSDFEKTFLQKCRYFLPNFSKEASIYHTF